MNNNKVLYNVDQSADTSAEEKKRARNNIGAVAAFREVRAKIITHTVTAAEASNGYFDIDIDKDTEFDEGEFNDILGASFAVETLRIVGTTQYERELVPVHITHYEVKNNDSLNIGYSASAALAKVDTTWQATTSMPVIVNDGIKAVRIHVSMNSGDLEEDMQFVVRFSQFVQ